MDNITEILKPEILQNIGFAGFALIELTIIVWCIKTIIKINADVTSALRKLTDTILTKQIMEERLCKQMDEVRDTLLRRPCIIDKK